MNLGVGCSVCTESSGLLGMDWQVPGGKWVVWEGLLALKLDIALVGPPDINDTVADVDGDVDLPIPESNSGA